MEQRAVDFEAMVLRLASPQDIMGWSNGEVTKPETINYRTQRPERDGLFCEKIFGPTKDYECYCGKYRRIRYKGIICDKCGVEVTKAQVRRERMAHIELAAPVAHIWFVRSVPSRIGLIFDTSVSDAEKVVYFAGYIVTSVDEKAREEVMRDIEREFKVKSKNPKDKDALKEGLDKAKAEIKNLKKYAVLSEVDYHRLSLKYANVFDAGTGAETLRNLCAEIDLGELRVQIEKDLETASALAKKKILARYRLVRGMERARIRPEWMFLTTIPVIPPDLRPMVPLDGGRHASSDVNDLYRRVINRNNRLKRLYDLKAPEVITRNEKRMLQEAVDALIDNSIKRSGTPVASQTQRRPLRSLADMLKGKQGRFRQNLLGKRVDYSARSVIVVGPELTLDQCGLPKHMALELFKPFVIHKILERELAHNIRGASRLIDEKTSEIWAILEEVIDGKYVMLNRAPTLHRLGIQAFQPILIEGNAIKLHPLVCSAFNADFDGDQMAVHVPLTDEAQKEAREIIAATKNLLKPGSGDASVTPSQDIILGCYWLSKIEEGGQGEGKSFASKNEAVLAHDVGDIGLRSKVRIFTHMEGSEPQYLETTVGRILFNIAIPNDFGFVNEVLGKKQLSRLIGQLLRRYGQAILPPILDKIKTIGFEYMTRSGISWGMDDLVVPEQKEQIIADAKEEVNEVESQFDNGLLTEEERYRKVVEVWSRVKDSVSQLIPDTLDKEGPVYSMVDASARGSWMSISQMAGMKGLVLNPSGRIIELPVLSSFKEGLSVLEYFISTHGARKGTADTALKTAVAGYLTRRLVDVSQDIVVTESDCGVDGGVIIKRADLKNYGLKLSQRIFGRTLAGDLKDKKTGKTVFKKGHFITIEEAEAIDENEGVEEAYLRSPINCTVYRGICQTCYGYDLGSNTQVKLGEAVGIVAAQAIGEPGTQLTMRTFHLGGISTAGGDITLGLPRVEEIFEARTPKNPATISKLKGKVIDITEQEKEKIVVVAGKTKDGGAETEEYVIPFGRMLTVARGDEVTFGQSLSDGSIDITELYEASGQEKVQNYILNEVSRVYALQGATINGKHIEVVVRQMFSRLKITDSGDTTLAIGEVVERPAFIDENIKTVADKGKPAIGEPLLMGITRVALSTSSFLSAASFMETSRVLIRAALEGREDPLLGLKENVIIGHLIPAGTGFVPKDEGKKKK
ncbi:MAG: DNA-directed RNA polymerase subunit beta' [bacterium]|nr:DNA-directed RNA polymerase subunit beta' [bacterium]